MTFAKASRTRALANSGVGCLSRAVLVVLGLGIALRSRPKTVLNFILSAVTTLNLHVSLLLTRPQPHGVAWFGFSEGCPFGWHSMGRSECEP